jgi:hypothetical protein
MDDDFLRRMIDFYGEENIPNPEHYPLSFEFRIKGFIHHEKMKRGNIYGIE